MNFKRQWRFAFVWLAAVVALSAVFWTARGGGSSAPDRVEMQNGDRYTGKILSFTNDVLVLQSERLGLMRLSRKDVATISLGGNAPVGLARPVEAKPGAAPAATVSAAPAQAPAAPAPSAPAAAEALPDLSSHSNLIQAVKSQFLAGAGPEANGKFDELMGGLMSGKLSVNDVRAQARVAADQIREYKKELGNDAGWALDSYLAVLDHFLKETPEPPAPVTTNTIRQSVGSNRPQTGK